MLLTAFSYLVTPTSPVSTNGRTLLHTSLQNVNRYWSPPSRFRVRVSASFNDGNLPERSQPVREDAGKVKVFDTTLRDGELSRGVSLGIEDKLLIARQLYKLGVDVIEAGFPASSSSDFLAVTSIAKEIGNLPTPPTICGLARPSKADIDKCFEAIRHAAYPRIHTYLVASRRKSQDKELHRRNLLSTTLEAVKHAKSLCEDVEFSAADVLNTDPDQLCEILELAIQVGATTLSIPDTFGVYLPGDFGDLIKLVASNVRGIENVTISAHTHNDLGLAVANTLSAIENGARQAEVSVNGIGARAGNAALEEVVMALHVRQSHFCKYFASGSNEAGPLTNIKISKLQETSRLVSQLTGMHVQPNKAIVGANAHNFLSERTPEIQHLTDR
ncbi:2-isopropylmalate synthase [Gracilariopsis chorda]|uniref:2-isopropylmalate synthase n=1 Tax=Gracilariopsis chorda TaxID=448386 RepID=A0A2V3J602_9FLOR|nr:2-isopropylmalate synthase [Gracilariopsis chorda]|eukprot:PXF49417.1 2-isopropylmalate synthase [Gracilariopsis chorda]